MFCPPYLRFMHIAVSPSSSSAMHQRVQLILFLKVAFEICKQRSSFVTGDQVVHQLECKHPSFTLSSSLSNHFHRGFRHSMACFLSFLRTPLTISRQMTRFSVDISHIIFCVTLKLLLLCVDISNIHCMIYVIREIVLQDR